MAAEMQRYTNTTQDPFLVIKNLKQRYRKGLTLAAPDMNDRVLNPEDLLNSDISLGACDNPLILALVASRDPMVTVSMAAASRLSPYTIKHKLMAGIYHIVGDVTRHTEVKDCVNVMVKNNFDPHSLPLVKKHVVNEIYKKRQFYRTMIRNNLRYLIEGRISPDRFVTQFLMGMNQLNLKTQHYTKMTTDFLLSTKFRPKVKMMLLQRFYQMPKDVRTQVILNLCNAPKAGHNEAIRDELVCMLQEEPTLLNEPLNQNAQRHTFYHPYPKSHNQLARVMNDQAFKTAEDILAS